MNEFPARSLEDLLDHSPEDSRSWDLKRAGNGTANVYKDYRDWLNGKLLQDEAKYAAASMCFLDITLPNIDNKKFFGIVLTQGEEQEDAYRKAVTELNTKPEGSRTVGSHEVFQAGLPCIITPEGEKSPSTRGELEKYMQNGEIKSDRFFEWRDPAWTALPESELRGHSFKGLYPLEPKQVLPEDFGHPSNLNEFERTVEQVSEKPIDKNWDIFTECLKERKNKITNARGEPLSLVWGIPLCIWAEESDQKLKPVPLAQIFIGYGGVPAQIEEPARRLLQTIALHAFRVNATARAESLGAQRSKRIRAHRLPYVLHGIVDNLQAQRESVKEINIPPEAFVLKNLAFLWQKKPPVWPQYEEIYYETNSFPKVIDALWYEIAVNVGEARLSVEEHPTIFEYFPRARKPDLKIYEKGHIIFNERKECAALISLCCPLIIEAYHHAYISSILEFSRGNHDVQVLVRVTYYNDGLCIENPYHEPLDKSLKSPRTLLDGGSQIDEVRDIERITGRIWEVNYPNLESLSVHSLPQSWTVSIKRSAENG